MPEIIVNEDGTRTFAINSSELHALKDQVERKVPDLKKAVRLAQGNDVRAALAFVKAVLDGNGSRPTSG
jgi:hypothetical protein